MASPSRSLGFFSRVLLYIEGSLPVVYNVLMKSSLYSSSEGPYLNKRHTGIKTWRKFLQRRFRLSVGRSYPDFILTRSPSHHSNCTVLANALIITVYIINEVTNSMGPASCNSSTTKSVVWHHQFDGAWAEVRKISFLVGYHGP